MAIKTASRSGGSSSIPATVRSTRTVIFDESNDVNNTTITVSTISTTGDYDSTDEEMVRATDTSTSTTPSKIMKKARTWRSAQQQTLCQTTRVRTIRFPFSVPVSVVLVMVALSTMIVLNEDLAAILSTSYFSIATNNKNPITVKNSTTITKSDQDNNNVNPDDNNNKATNCKYDNNDEEEVIDTAIILSSSWIPIHPSTVMIDTVINSTLTNVIGLSPHTPIVITVDQMKPKDQQDNIEKVQALDQYVMNLYETYMTHPNIHIMVSMEHWHVGGNTLKALKLIQHLYPAVEYLYYTQHDLQFIRPINHTALVQTLQSYPNHVNYIRFKDRFHEEPRPCNAGTSSSLFPPSEIQVVGGVTTDGTTNATIYHTSKYSDRTHIVRFQWYYDHVIEPMKMYKRFPENPLQFSAGKACKSNSSMGLYTYGFYDKPVIRNLDGRKTLASPIK